MRDCLCLYVCALASSVLLFVLRAMLRRGPRDKQGTSWRPPAGLESRARGSGSLSLSDIHLAADSLSSLYEQKVAVCGFCGKSM